MLLTTNEAKARFETGNYEVIRQRSFGGSSYFLQDKQTNVWHSLRHTVGKKLFDKASQAVEIA